MSLLKDKKSSKTDRMLTQDILFGMNILTLAGFAVMGLTLTLNRIGQAGKLLSISTLPSSLESVIATVGLEKNNLPRPRAAARGT